MDWNIVVLMSNIIVVLNSYVVKIIALVKVENTHFQSNWYFSIWASIELIRGKGANVLQRQGQVCDEQKR